MSAPTLQNEAEPVNTPRKRLIKRRQFAAVIGSSIPTIRRLQREDPDFPKPVRMRGQFLFVEDEAHAYVSALIARRDQAA